MYNTLYEKSLGESMFIHLPLIRGLLDFCNGLYAKATYATGYVPTYPCGQIGYLLASKNEVSFFTYHI